MKLQVLPYSELKSCNTLPHMIEYVYSYMYVFRYVHFNVSFESWVCTKLAVCIACWLSCMSVAGLFMCCCINSHACMHVCLYKYVCVHVCFYVCMCVYMYACQSNSPSVSQPVCSSVGLSAWSTNLNLLLGTRTDKLTNRQTDNQACRHACIPCMLYKLSQCA